MNSGQITENETEIVRMQWMKLEMQYSPVAHRTKASSVLLMEKGQHY